MPNGIRLVIAVIGGGLAVIVVILGFVLVSVALTNGPPPPRWSIALPFVYGAVAMLLWRHADAIGDWLEKTPAQKPHNNNRTETKPT